MLRSGATMRGYWGHGPGRGRRVDELIDAEATAAVLAADGWLTTGDFGRLTPEGNLQLSGRAHERYIRGGYNVYPAEVEEALSSHPAVARAAVVGVPDDVLGEIGVAVVVAAGGAVPELDELRAHCARAAVRLQGPRRAGGRRRAAADPDDEGRPVARLAAVAAGGAERRGARSWRRIVVPPPGC